MALKKWVDTDGTEHYMVERKGVLYPFGIQESAEYADSLSDEELAGFWPWEGALPAGLTDVVADPAPTAE